MLHFEVVWQSNYNGVGCYGDDDNMTDEEIAEVDAVIDDICDDVGDTLPDYTYEVASRWEVLSDENIKELLKRALVIINKYFPHVTIDNLSYTEDDRST